MFFKNFIISKFKNSKKKKKKTNHSKKIKEDFEIHDENNTENGSKLISDNQNKTNILTRIKKHSFNEPPANSSKEKNPEKDISKLRKPDLGDFISKKVKTEEKKQEEEKKTEMKKPQFESKKAFEKQRVFAEKNDNNNDQYFTPFFDK